MGLSVKSLSARSPRSEMSAVVPLGGNPISLHCLKLVLTSFGFERLDGMSLTSTSFPCTQYKISEKTIICNEKVLKNVQARPASNIFFQKLLITFEMENGVRYPKGKKNNVNLANAMAQESHQPVFKIDYPCSKNLTLGA